MKKNYDFSEAVKNPYAKLSKSKLDKLGEKLKTNNIAEEDLRTLNDYRLSFSEAHNAVISGIRTDLKLEPTGRPAKSTTSISDKLRRESIRLTQIQDIAGCRLIVEDVKSQDETTKALVNLFPSSLVLDRRIKPSHGYRAVHVVVTVAGKRVEVQVRTLLQHIWAELCEKLSDTFDRSIKYGGGDQNIREFLEDLSNMVLRNENLEFRLITLHGTIGKLSPSALTGQQQKVVEAARIEIEVAEKEAREARDMSIRHMREIIDRLSARS